MAPTLVHTHGPQLSRLGVSLWSCLITSSQGGVKGHVQAIQALLCSGLAASLLLMILVPMFLNGTLLNVVRSLYRSD